MNLRRLTVAIMVLIVLSSVAWPSVTRADEGGKERPFKGTAEGVVTEIVTPSDWIIDYVGDASHLGTFTRREWVTFNADGTFEGTMTFIAANGDELDLDFSGVFVTPNDAVGTYTFTGGSGRFADASGKADFYAFTSDFVHVSVEFAGSIDY